MFKATEVITIAGFSRECECSHCGRELKVGVRLEGFGGVYGADCLARATGKQVAGGYSQKLNGEAIKTRAIVAGKGAAYAMDSYGWQLGGPVFKLTLKTDLKSI